jgi:LPXTG-motif cell wall-anchored protein
MKLSKKLLFAISTLALLVQASPSFAAKFANQFTEFELPPQWQCNLEGAEWVCQSTNEAKKKDAIIVLAAKLKGDQDSMDQYLAYLKAPKSYTSVQGKPVKSDAKYAKIVNLNGQPWVDALHMESEIPGFYTRYLATIKEDIGVLVTYSINKDKYQNYLEDFENMVRTLKVFRKPGINAAPANGNIFANAQIPQGVSPDSVFNAQVAPTGGSDQPQKKPQDNSSMMIIGLVVAVLGFIIWKRRKGAGG